MPSVELELELVVELGGFPDSEFEFDDEFEFEFEVEVDGLLSPQG